MKNPSVAVTMLCTVLLSAPTWAQTSFERLLPENDQSDLVAEEPALSPTAQDEAKTEAARLTRDGIRLVEAGKYKEAEPLIAKALRIRRETLGEQHPETLVANSNYARILITMGRAAEAEPYLLFNQRAYRDTLGEEHPKAISNSYSYGVLLSRQGRYKEAEAIEARALQRSRKVLGAEHPVTLQILNSYGATLFSLGRPAEAQPLFEQVMVIRGKTLGEEHPDTLISMVNVTAAMRARGYLNQAAKIYVPLYNRSKKVRGEKHPETIRILNHYASVLDDLGRSKEAEPLHYLAWKSRKEVLGVSHPDTLISMSNYAGSARSIGLVKEAEQAYALALSLTKHALGDEHPNVRVLEGNLANTRMMLPTHAHRALPISRSIVSDIRSRVSATGNSAKDEAEIDRKEYGRAYQFRFFMDAAWARGPGLSDEALAAGVKKLSNDQMQKLRLETYATIQDAQGSAASKAVAQTAARRAVGEVAAYLEAIVIRRQELSDQWIAADKDLVKLLSQTDEAAESKRAAIRTQLRQLEKEIQSIDTRLAEEAPEYFALVRPGPLSLEETQQLVGEEDAALIVVPARYGTHVIAVTAEGISWARSDWDEKKINASVKRLLWDVGADVNVTAVESVDWAEEGEGAYPFDRGTAHDLYNEIIAPVSKSLAGKRHLFVATSGSLSSLPFGLLVTNPPTGNDGNPSDLRATQWFADVHALVQVPSLQSLAFLRRFRSAGVEKGSATSFIGFGDPVLEGEAVTRGGNAERRRGGNKSIALRSAYQSRNAGTDGGMADVGQVSKLARLPGTAIEINALRSAFDANDESIFLGRRATEANLRSLDLSGSRILALATHGLMAGELDGVSEPALVFTPPEKATLADDGLLTSSEIAELNLNADWVILSACNTAAGDGSNGAPGLSGIARSFFYAGARNLLASHWPVRDDVAAKITTRTVEIKRDNPKLSRAEAFQLAMREIRNEQSMDSGSDTWAHPNAWAPFTLIGDR